MSSATKGNVTSQQGSKQNNHPDSKMSFAKALFLVDPDTIHYMAMQQQQTGYI